jgi:hypothetical protein
MAIDPQGTADPASAAQQSQPSRASTAGGSMTLNFDVFVVDPMPSPVRDGRR